ncbi:MAG TPA: TIM barrel protein [Pirellulales bacterium]|nr:TIM barrel protein [Pirellulales bacterium]
MRPNDRPARREVSRRQLLATAAAAGAVALHSRDANAADGPVASKGDIKQSLVQWCYSKYWDIDEMCRMAKQLGCVSIELADPKDWPTIKKHGLVCAIATSHGFEKGMNNPEHHEMCLEKIRTSIDACAEYGFPNVITFTGFRENIPDDVGLANCVKGFKKIVGYAEKKKVNLCLEMLNSRVNVEMKGHPGYQGDHTDYCMEIIREVGSPRMKLLFDIYHVQIMDGDVIVRLKQYADYIAHVHTAGNPGRRELDDQQEINYPPIMKALLDVGYTGYVGQEFIPTRDPLDGLRQAVALCDV